MKTKLFATFLGCVIVLAACKKETSGSTTTNSDTTDYQPTSTGSTWTYNSSSQGSYTETATGTDTTINGDKYSVFSNSNGAAANRYVNKSNGVYKVYSYVAPLQQTLTLTYLKDVSVGTNWEDNVTVTTNNIAIPVNFKYNIASRDGDKTVNGIDFKNVIEVTYDVSANIPLTGTVQVGTGQDYYAKGVGLITRVINANVQGTAFSDSTYLVSYQIK